MSTTNEKPNPYVLPELEANEKKALKKFNETGEVSPVLLSRFDQNGKFRVQIDMNKRGADKTLDLIKAIREITLAPENISTTSTEGIKTLHTGFYDKESLEINADWDVIEGPIRLHLCQKANFPNLKKCLGKIEACNAKTFLAPKIEEAQSIELSVAEELSLPALKKMTGSLRTNAASILLPNITEIEGSIEAKETKVFEAPNLQKAGSIDLLDTKRIEFPNLKTIRGGFQSYAKTLLAPKLTSTTRLSINGSDKHDLSELKSVEHQIVLSGMGGTIPFVNLPALEEVDEISALKVESLHVPSLKKVGYGIAGYSSLKELVVPDEIPLKKLYITDELLASIKASRIPKLQAAGKTTLVAEPPRVSAFQTSKSEGHTAECTFWVTIKDTKTAEEAANTLRHAKIEIKSGSGFVGQSNWIGVRALPPTPVENETNTWEIPCLIKVFLSGKTIDAARKELDKLYQDITTRWDNGITKSDDQQVCRSGAWGFSIRESNPGELYWDERSKPRDPWGNVWQRQPNLYPWEEIQATDSLEEAIAKAKIIYNDASLELLGWELKRILAPTHPEFEE